MPKSHQPPADAETRFSNRVENYVKYRPSYPPAVVDLLIDRCELGPGSVVADLGAGTGILSRLLLETGATVHAIEPNGEMRAALVAASPSEPNLHVHGTPAEASGLAENSVDLITAAQAFHWFDRGAARREFARILRPGGWVALIWNTRCIDTPFLAAYEAMLHRWATDYRKVEHRNVGQDMIQSFFTPGRVDLHQFPYAQHFDPESLRGRFLSSSYAPTEGHPHHEPAIQALRALFETHAVNGQVRFNYTTEVYLGRLG